MFHARPHSGCSASSSQNSPAAATTGGASAAIAATTPCRAVPPFSFSSIRRA